MSYGYNLADQVKNADMGTYNWVNNAWQNNWWNRVNYAYKASGALSGIGTTLNGGDANNTTSVLNTTNFRATGAIKSLNYGNGLQLNMSYSPERQQPTSMKVGPNGSGTVLDYAYSYNDAGGHNNNRIRQITDNLDGAYTVSYSYDPYNRLKAATSGAYIRKYQYDAWGNLITLTGNPGYVVNYALQQGAPAGAGDQ